MHTLWGGHCGSVEEKENRKKMDMDLETWSQKSSESADNFFFCFYWCLAPSLLVRGQQIPIIRLVWYGPEVAGSTKYNGKIKLSSLTTIFMSLNDSFSWFELASIAFARCLDPPYFLHRYLYFGLSIPHALAKAHYEKLAAIVIHIHVPKYTLCSNCALCWKFESSLLLLPDLNWKKLSFYDRKFICSPIDIKTYVLSWYENNEIELYIVQVNSRPEQFSSSQLIIERSSRLQFECGMWKNHREK